MTPPRTELTPQLLSRLSEGVPSEITAALASVHEADLAEALNRVDSGRAAEVISALPFEFAVRVVEHPELERRHEVFHHFPTDKAVAFIEAMSADQQADLFRGLPDADRTRFLEDLDASTRATLALLLRFRRHRGRHHDDRVRERAGDWTVEQALRPHRESAARRRRCTRSTCSIPATARLVHVVSLRELMVRRPRDPVGAGRAIGARRSRWRRQPTARTSRG